MMCFNPAAIAKEIDKAWTAAWCPFGRSHMSSHLSGKPESSSHAFGEVEYEHRKSLVSMCIKTVGLIESQKRSS